jgi:hypothetical protein
MLLKYKGPKVGLYVDEIERVMELYREKYGRFPLRVYKAALSKWAKRGFTTDNPKRRLVEDEIR